MAKDQLDVWYVRWNDAHQTQDNHTDDDIDEFHVPCVTHSVGYLVRKSRKGVTIAACVDEDISYDRLLFIPRGMIVKMEQLSGKASRNKTQRSTLGG